jgi:hypothetical protein
MYLIQRTLPTDRQIYILKCVCLSMSYLKAFQLLENYIQDSYLMYVLSKLCTKP